MKSQHKLYRGSLTIIYNVDGNQVVITHSGQQGRRRQVSLEEARKDYRTELQNGARKECVHYAPPAGTWAATARMMARGDRSGFDWDRWKDERKENY